MWVHNHRFVILLLLFKSLGTAVVQCRDDASCRGNSVCSRNQCYCPDPYFGDECKRKLFKNNNCLSLTVCLPSLIKI